MGNTFPKHWNSQKKGVLLEPGNTYYQLDLAQVLSRMRKYDEAQDLANRAGANSLDPNARKNADRFIEYIQELRNAETQGSRARGPSPPADEDVEVDTATNSAQHETSEPCANDGKRRIDGTVTEVECKVQEMILASQPRMDR